MNSHLESSLEQNAQASQDEAATVSPATPGQDDPAAQAPKLDLIEMTVSFVSPALFGKVCIAYFGSMYSAQPGKGWGIALCAAILFTVTMLMRFVWRYRHYSE